MKSDRKISIAITTYNRYDLTIESFAQVIDDPRIDEIVIEDDASIDGSGTRLIAHFYGHNKVVVWTHGTNMDCYNNKALVMSRCTNNFALLLDSDNIITTETIDSLYQFPKWHTKRSYCPVFARPHFDYRDFSGLVFTRRNIKHYIDNPIFFTALNTMNFFINCDQYAKTFDNSIDPVTADSMYFNYLWLKKGGSMLFVPGMEYEHRIFADSHFQNNRHRTGEIERNVETLLRLL